MWQATFRLAPQGNELLDTKLKAAFEKCGKIPAGALARLDWLD